METSSTRLGLDIERQGNPDDWRLAPIPTDVSDLQEGPGQCCFVCLESYSQGQYAVLVPCLRPRRRRTTRKNDLPGASNNETDSEIYQRLLDTCYQYLGQWKRWLPYYGIIEVLEVNFYFAGRVESNGRYSIYMEPVNVDKILEECKERIAWQPTNHFLDPGDVCVKCDRDSDGYIDMEELCPECFRVEVETARKKLKRLLFLSHFKECARNPKKADGLNNLKGMAQKSCIYDRSQVNLPVQSKEFEGTESMIGLHFVLGWQADRIHAELPFGVSCALLAVALIWLCLLIWRGAGGDWGTAFAFAQVVAASFAIIITYARL